MCQVHLALEIDALIERHATIRASQLEIGADYLVICQVIKDDPKLFASRPKAHSHK